MILALAAVCSANPLLYPAAGSAVVRSDRVGGNFAYSINTGAPLAYPYYALPAVKEAPKPVPVATVPAWGYSYGYPSVFPYGYPLLAAPAADAPAADAPAAPAAEAAPAADAPAAEATDAEIVEAA